MGSVGSHAKQVPRMGPNGQAFSDRTQHYLFAAGQSQQACHPLTNDYGGRAEVDECATRTL